MLPQIPVNGWLRTLYVSYVVLFFVYLALPLAVVSAFAFNDSNFPSLPWQGFTLDWFFGQEAPRIGVFGDRQILRAIGTSALVAVWVAALAVLIGTCNAFLFERFDFPFKSTLYIIMLIPLVVPGIILGISILVFSSRLANLAQGEFGMRINALRPGLPLVILGQFSFIATMATLVISARLRKFDRSLEEAALNLGAPPWEAIRHVTLPFLAPAMLAAGIVSLLMSFENFNTTLMLVGSDAPLTVTMFDRLKQGSTPVLNAVSLLLMAASFLLALVLVIFQRGDRK
jgi:spermidine/putrescine transport system permease protein